jgi:ADP-heptose:LPS heptosyltransferase
VRHNADSILIIDASPFGQVLSLLASVKPIREAYKSSRITVAASTGACELAAMMRLADKTIDLGVIKDSKRGAAESVRTFFKLTKRTGRAEFDLVLDFSRRPETQLLSVVALRTRTIAARTGLPELLDLVLGRKGPARPDSDQAYRSVLRQIGLRLDETESVCGPTAADSQRFEEVIEKRGSRGGGPIAVMYSADAGQPDSWPVQNYAEVAARLAQNFGARIVAADVPSDSAFTIRIEGMLGRDAVRLRAPHAPELVAALARASFVIVDDSGLARFAARLGTPSVVVGPLRRQEETSLTRALPRGSAPEDVYSVACEMLQKSRMASIFERG